MIPGSLLSLHPPLATPHHTTQPHPPHPTTVSTPQETPSLSHLTLLSSPTTTTLTLHPLTAASTPHLTFHSSPHTTLASSTPPLPSPFVTMHQMRESTKAASVHRCLRNLPQKHQITMHSSGISLATTTTTTRMKVTSRWAHKTTRPKV